MRLNVNAAPKTRVFAGGTWLLLDRQPYEWQ